MSQGLVVLLLSWSCTRLSNALHLTVRIHYPNVKSTVDLCGFTFSVEAASANDPSDTVAHSTATFAHKDLFIANFALPNSYLYTEAILAVAAEFRNNTGIGKIWEPECQKVCPRISPQGNLVNSGPFIKTQPLRFSDEIDVWPDFGCQKWGSMETSFHSAAIGRHVHTVARLPASQIENTLPRPSDKLPPILFRMNSEWYWDHPDEEYNVWHSLMVNGEMEPFVVVEIYVKDVTWQDWATQPIYTTESPRKKCGRCSSELEFICERWERTGYPLYAAGGPGGIKNHSYGVAGKFFGELYNHVMPHLLDKLSSRTDHKAVRAGVWGYCIGGLAAWNAVTSQPDLFNMAYLGSPAMDFDCGDPFSSVSTISPDSHGLRPKIYIDSGADEGEEMNRQSILLFTKLQDQGLVDGQDVWYNRQPFGTHQGRSFLRRALKALLTMFGSGRPPRETFNEVQFTTPHKKAIHHHVFHPIGPLIHVDAEPQTPWLLTALMSAVSFVAGLFIMHLVSGRYRQLSGIDKKPFLGR